MNKLTMQNLGHLAGSRASNQGASELFSGVESERGTKGNVPGRSTENNPDGSVWREHANLKGTSTNGKVGTEYTGWDPRGNAFPRVRAPSTVMSDEYGFGSGRGSRPSGFAKVKVDSPFPSPFLFTPYPWVLASDSDLRAMHAPLPRLPVDPALRRRACPPGSLPAARSDMMTAIPTKSSPRFRLARISGGFYSGSPNRWRTSHPGQYIQSHPQVPGN